MARRGFHALTALVALAFLFAIARATYVPVYVMLPLDIVDTKNASQLAYPDKLGTWFTQLKNGNVDGVMVDVWWGVVENGAPQKYNWDAYLQLLELVKSHSLGIQVIMSFHKCGGNTGDACNIPLPQWVASIGSQNPSIYYTDASGKIDDEYLSLGIDDQPVLSGRTAVQVYADFMKSFAQAFSSYFASTIKSVEIGLGPAGEMRYPSYQLDRWSFPGIGAYDKYMLSNLKSAANASGHPEWGVPPTNAGTYNDVPSNTGFFSDGGANNYASPYGVFFLSWYSSTLISHGDAILSQAVATFGSLGVKIGAKVAGIHWWYKTAAHAAEVTAGYFNTDSNDAYAKIAAMLNRHGAGFIFTCLEMRDSEQPSSASCGPEELVDQTRKAAQVNGLGYSGENALARYDQTAYDEIVAKSKNNGSNAGFTYLRLCDTLTSEPNWTTFKNFVSQMHA